MKKVNSPPYGAIAQLGERIVRNDEVVGSIPTSSTIFSTTCKRTKTQSCHTLSHKIPELAGELRQSLPGLNASPSGCGTGRKPFSSRAGMSLLLVMSSRLDRQLDQVPVLDCLAQMMGCFGIVKP